MWDRLRSFFVPTGLVFIDEAGANIAMSRSHACVPRGEDYVKARAGAARTAEARFDPMDRSQKRL